MNLRARLEEEHSKALTEKIIAYVGKDKKRFRILFDLFMNGTPVVVKRAAWPLGYIVIAHPELIKGSYARLLSKLESPANHDAVTRTILRIFQDTDIPEDHEARILDLCIGYIRQPSSAIAVRAFAITTACKIAKKYSELVSELLLVLDELRAQPHSPALSVRIKLALKELRPAISKV